MKVPPSPPNWTAHLKTLDVSGLEKISSLTMGLDLTDERGRYLSWNELRFRPPPLGFSHTDWWVALKLKRRAASRSLRLGPEGEIFHFTLPSSLLAELHWLDQNTAGTLLATQDLLSAQHKQLYLINSLYEESITSSQLEGASTTRDVAKKMLREGRRPRNAGERMVFNNYLAMDFVSRNRESALTPEFILEIHRLLTAGTMDDSLVGAFRGPDDDVHVTNQIHDILYTPPPAEKVPAWIDALCRFADEPEGVFLHPVIKAIVIHFLVGYVHPFVDGNGRTARALNYWFLLKNRYWLMEFLSISRILRQAPSQYAKAYLDTETDENDLTYFLEHQLRVFHRAVDDLYLYINKKQSDLTALDTELHPFRKVLNGRQLALLRHALKHPGYIYTIQEHKNIQGIAYESARTDLLELAEKWKLFPQVKTGKAFQFLAPIDLKERLKKSKIGR